jgi:ribosome-binding factor A
VNEIRAARMAEELRQQIADILQNHLSDPRLTWVSVVRVEVSPDLRHAKVFVSVLGSEDAQSSSLRVLSRATSAVRAELARRIRLRKVPEIVFRADHSIAYSIRIQNLLQELGLAGEELPPAGGTEDKE